MASARVIALSSGDMASGALTCVVRRAAAGAQMQYDLEIRNDSESSASVVLSHDDVTITTIVVAGGEHYQGQQTLAVADTPIRVDVTCDGTALAACEIDPALALPGSDGRSAAIALSPQARVPKGGDVEVLAPEPARGPTMTRVPASKPPRRRAPLAVPALFTCLVAAALVAGFVYAHPHVGQLGAPNAVLEGSVVDVPYSTSGLGRLRYSVVSSQGTAIAGGPLTAPSGVLHIGIPTLHHDEAYRVRLALSGPLGDASDDATIGANALPVVRVVTALPAAPLVRSFAVATSVKDRVPTVTAFYDVTAERGTLRLIDDRGIQYGAAPLNPNGQATFTLPANTNLGTLAIVLQAMRNGMTTEARIAFPATSSPDTDTVVASPPPSETAADGPPIAVPDRAVGGTPIRIRVLHHYPQLHVALLGEDARQFVDVDVPPDASSVTLPHPSVASTTRMIVEATYRVQNEADMIVRPVLLIPAGR